MMRQRVAASLGRRRRDNSTDTPPDVRDHAIGNESSSDEDEEDTPLEGKPWMIVDKSVYEEQLEKLQEQLVQVMLENQALQGTCAINCIARFRSTVVPRHLISTSTA